MKVYVEELGIPLETGDKFLATVFPINKNIGKKVFCVWRTKGPEDMIEFLETYGFDYEIKGSIGLLLAKFEYLSKMITIEEGPGFSKTIILTKGEQKLLNNYLLSLYPIANLFTEKLGGKFRWPFSSPSDIGAVAGLDTKKYSTTYGEFIIKCEKMNLE